MKEAYDNYQLRPPSAGRPEPTIHSPVEYIIECVRAMKQVPPEYTRTEVFVKIGPAIFKKVETTIAAVPERILPNKFFPIFKNDRGEAYEGPIDIIAPVEYEAAKGLMELDQDIGGVQLLMQLSGGGGGAAGGAGGGAKGGGSSVRRRKRTRRRSQRKTRRSLRR
jgi:uncharacterized membrane protein YgcG